MKTKNQHNIYNISMIIWMILFLFLATMSLAYGSPVGQPIHGNYVPVCPKDKYEKTGYARCFSQVIADIHGKPRAMTGPIGYQPADFLNAYKLNGMTTTNQIIAIVDAYDDPNIISDLNQYSTSFGLSSIANCAVNTGSPTSPCFQKVDQRGGNQYPQSDPGWILEISLDVEIAHAICQNCNILLVESDDSSLDNLMVAIDESVNMGANVISNSWGINNEFNGETFYDYHLNLPGKSIVFASMDSGYGVPYPAVSPYVTSVGGTTLTLNPRTETVWGGTGSGCSVYENKPSFQKDVGCSMRTINDVSADADPNTGAAIYDSFGSGWYQVGGTSLATPIIGGIYALAGGGFSGYGNAVLYRNYVYGLNLNDITSGSNGKCGSYLCNGLVGYDGPTGLGSPAGTGAFADLQVTNPGAIPSIILNDNGRARPSGTNLSNLSITVSGNVKSVLINLSPVGGSSSYIMTNLQGTSIYSVSTDATVGINSTNSLIVSATDIFGNSNNSVSIPLQVLMRGDITGDGKVDLKDLLLQRKYIAGLYTPPDLKAFLFIGDIYPATGDGVVDLKDLLFLRRYLAGLEPLI